MDILYKLRHKPSGLFFNPAYWQNKLDEKGRIYLKKPSLAKIGNVIRVSNQIAEKYKLKTVDTPIGYKGLEVVSDEWEICEFAVILNQTFDCPQPKKKEFVDNDLQWSTSSNSMPIADIQNALSNYIVQEPAKPVVPIDITYWALGLDVDDEFKKYYCR